ncbi:putative transcriptional regulator [Dokdonella fugitiva]|uniref:Putative transcriptional regulator n=1 Tax=Dokdonella fugitiva TaxID=328517 RepID=A0A839F1B1_9GAMM|nr:hypothetical protein [Dokdonella fugitiva]MBA8886104.1 putative transcriptional regulator [Dokdonella fugitiva]
MSRTPSAETQLRNLKRHASDIEKRLAESLRASGAYRARATKAEQEAAEWRRRFDELLFQRGKP